MKSCYLDANVLVYFKNEESAFFSQANFLIAQVIKEGYHLFISPLVIDEFLHGVKLLLQVKKIKEPDSFALLKIALKDILSLPNLKIINPSPTDRAQLKVVSLMKEFVLRPRDAYHLLMMLENKINYLATFDKDFQKVFAKKKVRHYTVASR